MSERRYSEAEAAEIFRVAAELEDTAPRPVVPTQGLTVGQLQEIGREAGLSPDLVARAARISVGSSAAQPRRFLGLPIGVGRTVELDRPFSDREWEQLVADLRETFEAKGVIRYDGPFRQWSNGNLHVLVEPTQTGHRLRFRTTNGNARSLISGGLATLGIAAGLFVVSAFTAATDALRGTALLATVGVALFTIGAIRLPGWARRRRGQMDELAERVMLSRESTDLTR
ncbi:MAG: hypothetical protein ACT4P7_20085 [Gemmatimonadaceae bacterium]